MISISLLTRSNHFKVNLGNYQTIQNCQVQYQNNKNLSLSEMHSFVYRLVKCILHIDSPIILMKLWIICLFKID